MDDDLDTIIQGFVKSFFDSLEEQPYYKIQKTSDHTILTADWKDDNYELEVTDDFSSIFDQDGKVIRIKSDENKIVKAIPDVDESNIESKLNNGILEVKIPRPDNENNIELE